MSLKLFFLFSIKRSCCAVQDCASICFSRKEPFPVHDPPSWKLQMPGSQMGRAAARRCMHLLGQASFWQALVSRASPSHGFPFIWGLGELQSRILVITPSPHVTEQDDHGDQWLQPPSCLTKGQTRWLYGASHEPSPVLVPLNALSKQNLQTSPMKNYSYPRFADEERASERVSCAQGCTDKGETWD